MISNDDEYLTEGDDEKEMYQGYTSIPYGLQLLHEYISPSKHCDFLYVTHNNKTNDYIILDSRGISSWRAYSIGSNVKRLLDFEAYKFNLIRSIIYSRFYNVYFALTKEYSIKVYNLNFHEICCTESDGSSVSRFLYNIKRNELITVCRGKIRFWKYSILALNSSFHGISLLREFDVAESLMLSSAEYDQDLQRIYLMSDINIYCYSNEGRCIFHLKGYSIGYFCACAYSIEAQLFIAGSIDGQLSIYNPSGGLVTTFLNHSRMVTSIVIHPADGNMFFSASMDGTIKLFSLQMLGEIHSISAFPEGVLFMNIPSKNIMYAASRKGMQLYNVNYSFKFWSTSRCPARRMSVTPQIANVRRYALVFTTDYSIRLYSQITGNRRSTVLPPPEINVGQDVLSIAFDRLGRVIYILFHPLKLWIYSTRTDPATRVAIWDLNVAIRQSSIYQQQYNVESREHKSFGASSYSQKKVEENISCHSLVTVKRGVLETEVTSDLLNFGFLFCGLSNGSVCILDPCKAGSLTKSFKAHITSPVIEMSIDYREEETHLLTLLHTVHGWIVRIWDVVSVVCFHQIHIQDDFTQFAYKNFQFVIGYSNGYLYNKIIQSSSYREDSILPTPGIQTMKDHDGAIWSVDIFEQRNLICSCGADKYVRVWDKNKVLLSEIKFDETLKYAVFLDKRATILISFMSQLFIIPHYVVFQGGNKHLTIQDELSSGDESFIFEDPLVRHDRKSLRDRVNVLTTLTSYLVPYPNLGLESLWMHQNFIASSDEKDSDGEASMKSSDSVCSFASTVIYQDSESEANSLEECNFVFPKCDDSPEPLVPVALIVDDEALDATEEVSDHIESEVLLNGEEIHSKDNIPVANESLYDRLRNITSVVSSSSSLPSRPSKKSSKAVTTSPSKQGSSSRTKKKKVKRTLKTKDRSKNLDAKSSLKESSHQDEDNCEYVQINNEVNEKDKTQSDAQSSAKVLHNVNLDLEQQQQSPVIILNRGTETSQDPNESSHDPNEMKHRNSCTPTSVPNRSLLAMATGKSSRTVSHSYQKVMSSLMNIPSPSASSSRPVSALQDDYEDDDEKILQLSHLVAGYEADTEGGSSLDVRGSQLHSRNNSRNTSRCSTANNKTRRQQGNQDRPAKTSGNGYSVNTIELSEINLSRKSISKENESLENKANRKHSQEILQPSPPKILQPAPPEIKISSRQSSFVSEVDVEDDPSIDSHKVHQPSIDLYKSTSKETDDSETRQSSSLSIDELYPEDIVVSSLSLHSQIHLNTKQSSMYSSHDMSSISIKMIQPSNDDAHDVAVPNLATDHDGVHDVFIMHPPVNKDAKEELDKKVLSASSSSTSVAKGNGGKFRRFVESQLESSESKDVASLILRLSMKNKRNNQKSSNSTNGRTEVGTGHEPIRVTIEKKKSNLQRPLSAEEDNNNNIINETAKENFLCSEESFESHKNAGNTLLKLNESGDENYGRESPDLKILSPPPDLPTTANTELEKDLFVTATPVKTTRNEKMSHLENTEESETKCVVKFILSSFKKPTSPRKKDRVQFKVTKQASVHTESDEGSLKEKESSVEINNEISTTQISTDETDSVFITPQNSKESFLEFSPVSSVAVRRSSSGLTSDESLMYHNKSSLYEKLQKHRVSKQRQKSRRESIQARRSVSSGYDTTSRDQLDSELSVRRSYSSQVRQRLSIKRSPITVNVNESVTPGRSKSCQRNSEMVYFEEYVPIARPISGTSCQEEEDLPENIRQEKIRNLEQKLSGQSHRYHHHKTAHEIEADRLTLLMLKKKKGLRLPVEKTSASIPGRFPHERIRNFVSSNTKVSQPSLIT